LRRAGAIRRAFNKDGSESDPRKYLKQAMLAAACCGASAARVRSTGSRVSLELTETSDE
jgi:hypothetical protein